MTTLKARLEKRLVDARSCDSDTYYLMGSAYETVIEELIRAVEALEDVESNYNHDLDAHRYGTTCRVCLASETLAEIEKGIGS